MPSWLLVALQFGLAAVLLGAMRWPGGAAAALTLVLAVAGVAVGIAALAVNRPGNFNIVPELKPGARLATTGIYRHLRHPMYSAFLLLTLAAALTAPSLWRLAVWLALLAVLIAKARREEAYLRAAFPEYRDYAARTARLLPGIY